MNYLLAILLLEYGADPYLHYVGTYWSGYNLLYKTVKCRNMCKLRVLLMANPNYEKVPGPDGRVTIKEWLEEWAQSGDGYSISHRDKRYTIPEIVDYTVKAAQELIRLKQQLQRAQADKNYGLAIACYRQMKAIYVDQAWLEMMLPYPATEVAKEPFLREKKNGMVSYYNMLVRDCRDKIQQLTEQAQAEGYEFTTEEVQAPSLMREAALISIPNGRGAERLAQHLTEDPEDESGFGCDPDPTPLKCT